MKNLASVAVCPRRLSNHDKEFKLHVYGKPQTSDSSCEFLKIENEQIKAAQNNFMDKQLRETTNLCVEIMNCKTTSKDETCSRGTNLRLLFNVHVRLNLSYLSINGDT